MLLTDPPQHGRLRRPVSRAFTPHRVAALRPVVTDLVDRLLDGLEGEVDMVKALAFPLPNDVIGLLALLTHPEEMDRLRADRSLATSAAEELLRWDSPVQLNLRTALGDTEAAGESHPHRQVGPHPAGVGQPQPGTLR